MSTPVQTPGLIALVSLAAAAAAQAQTDTSRTRRDSLRVHRLEEIVVHGVHRVPAPLPYTLAEIEPAAVARLDAPSVAQVARLVPAAHVQTNSRGETLVYLRDAGERQVAAFLDGALLNVPWDNRVDLSLVPAPMIGGLTVVKGVPPVEYGTNVVGGALNLTSRTLDDAGRRMEIALSRGTEGQLAGSLAGRGSLGSRWRYALALGRTSRDGLALPAGAALPYNQTDPEIRTNTDQRATNAAARAVHRFRGGTEVGVSLFHVDAQKGVAPEGHLDPARFRVRYWRYPLWQNTMGILSATGTVGSELIWKGAAWANRFRQNIDAYTSQRYDSLDSREEDRDFTAGARLVGQRRLGKSAVKLALNALTSRHRQRDLDLNPDGSPAAGTFPELAYRQVVVSTGVEYEVDPIDRLDVTAGMSFDLMSAPETGDKPAIEAFRDYSATLGLGYQLRPGIHVRGSVGRKSRFPTLRELFGEALNRFLLNPDLRPESSIITELAARFRGSNVEVEVVPFATFTSNTIDQRSVLLPGESRPRRQRINLRGSRVLGVELSAGLDFDPSFQAQGHLTVMQPRRLQDAPTDPIFLSEKPDVLGRLALSYEPAAGPLGLIEGVYTGRAYSLDEANQFVPLPRSLVLNVRAGYRFLWAEERRVEVFARVDNLSDEVVVPQLGLPAAGRTAQGGIKADF
jgi:iron complex outermembrane receptor protein